MQWQQKGRKKTEPSNTETSVEKPWTKKEMKMISDPVYELCLAIVEQWVKDGSHQKDYYGVEPYINLLRWLSENKNKNKE